MTDFRELQEISFRTNESKGFNRLGLAQDEEAYNNYLGNKKMLVVNELGEAQEELRSGHAATEIYEKDGKPEGYPIELADAVIRIMGIAGELGIDLNEAIETKQAYNAGRPFGHGRKF